jgi:hypothetical protein
LSRSFLAIAAASTSNSQNSLLTAKVAKKIREARKRADPKQSKLALVSENFKPLSGDIN